MNAIPTPHKAKTIETAQEKLKRVKGYVVLDYRGLTVSQISQLRRDLRTTNVELAVIKNTLFRIAAAETGTNVDQDALHGPTAILYAYDEPMEAVKALTKFMKGFPKIAIKSGAVENQVLTSDQVKALGKIPPKPILLSQMAGALQAPATKMACGLNALPTQFARLLQALVEEKGATA